MLARFRETTDESDDFMGFILWYSNPNCVEKEMRPPFLTVCKDLSVNCGIYCFPGFTVVGRRDSSFFSLEGYLRRNMNNLVFVSDHRQYSVDTTSYAYLNEKIEKLAFTSGKVKATQKIPVLESDDCTFQIKKTVQQADKLWLSGLVIARYAVTKFLLECLGMKEKPILVSTKHASSNCTESRNVFYAWRPFPRPSNLQQWLSYLGECKTSSFDDHWSTNCTPFVEGFYGLALSNSQKGHSEYSSTCEVAFNDGSSEVHVGYSDYAHEPSELEYDAGFVTEKGRVRISVSTPIALCTPNGDRKEGWGWSGHTAGSYLFLLPGILDQKSLLGPLRSSLSTTFVKTHCSRLHGVLQNGSFKELVSAANQDAVFNWAEFPSVEKVQPILFRNLHGTSHVVNPNKRVTQFDMVQEKQSKKRRSNDSK